MSVELFSSTRCHWRDTLSLWALIHETDALGHFLKEHLTHKLKLFYPFLGYFWCENRKLGVNKDELTGDCFALICAPY